MKIELSVCSIVNSTGTVAILAQAPELPSSTALRSLTPPL